MIAGIEKAAEAVSKVSKAAPRFKVRRGVELPRNQSKPKTDSIPVSFPWWQKES